MAATGAAAGGAPPQQWAEAFEAARQVVLPGAAGPLTPELVLEELKRAQEAERRLSAQLAALQARAAGALAATSAADAENLRLRQALFVAKRAAQPSVVQLRQLLLDPAVNREFASLRLELETRTREAAAARLELSTLKFGASGHDQLLAQLDRQRDELADLRRQLGEGRVARLERSLAAARDQLEDVRQAQAEAEEHALLLERQAEQLAEQLVLSQLGSGGRQQQQQQPRRGGPQPMRRP